MFNKNSLAISILVLGVALSASAAPFVSQTRSLTLPGNIVLQGIHLQAGEYSITWASHSPELTVTVSNGEKVLATASAKLVECSKAYERDTIVVSKNADGTRALRAIGFAGSSQAIVFDVGVQEGSQTRFMLPYSGSGTRRIPRIVR